MAADDVLTAAIVPNQCLDLTPDPLQSKKIVLTRPRQA
jgi:hypothetical protein